MMDLRVRKNTSSYTHTQVGQIRDAIVLKQGFQSKIQKFIHIFQKLDVQSVQEIWAVRGEYSESKLSVLIPYISEWKLTKLYLWSNKNSSLLKNISSISFPKLKQLHLGWNNIQSIQGLSNLKLECLTDLVLRDNKLTSVRSLRRCNLPNLKILCLRGNLINQFNFEDWDFSNLTQLNLNNNIVVNVAVVFQISSTKIKSLRAKQTDKIQGSTFELEVQSKLKFVRGRIHF